MMGQPIYQVRKFMYITFDMPCFNGIISLSTVDFVLVLRVLVMNMKVESYGIKEKETLEKFSYLKTSATPNPSHLTETSFI